MPDIDASNHDTLIAAFRGLRHELEVWKDSVAAFLGGHPDLLVPERHLVHSMKSRLKDESHLIGKIERKTAEGLSITTENIFDEITDLAGVRLLHLFQQDFGKIHTVIRAKVESGDWHLSERPKAYTWDPENVDYFAKFDLDVTRKESSYTSVHFLIRPRPESPMCCELQVRTLFEEIWGEVDHIINYPVPTDSLACKEQIKVLSKLTGAGSRLLDSLARVQEVET